MKKSNIVEYSALTLFLVVYLINCIFQNNLIGNLTAPFISFITVHLFYKCYKKADNYRGAWLAILIACLSWGISDSLWAYYDLVLGVDPNEMEIFIYSYFIMNACIVVAVALYFKNRFRKWNYMQLTLDISAITLIGTVLIWVLFFKGRTDTFITMGAASLVSFLYVFTDFLSVCSILLMYVSVRSRKVPITLNFSALAILMYSCTDVFFTYLDYSNQYIQNSLIDGFYMISIFIFALSAMIEYHHPNIHLEHGVSTDLPENIGRQYRMRYLFFIPAIMAIHNMKNLHEILIILFLLGLHYFVSSYVQIAIKNEHLLNREILLNDMLEDRIKERTIKLEEANQELEDLTNLDILTGLYNRRYFMNEVDKFIDDSQGQSMLSILYMDLDMFKAINDSHGHDMGDAVIIEISKRLKEHIPENSILARLGGDEFVIALKGEYSEAEILKVGDNMVTLMKEPIVVEPYFFNISVSIGIAVYPNDAIERNKLMKYADIAMYHAKAHDHHNVAMYRSFLSDRVERRHEIELLLRRAKFNEEFELYYQPQFSIPDSKLVGAEALLRWKTKTKGYISPAEFIPIAEESGMIVGIGDWVLTNAISQISKWNNKYGSDLRMGINISPKQVDSIHFLSNFEKLLKESKVNPTWIDIEITERIAMKGEIAMEEAFNSLTSLGVLVSIDDFGTGYSSLSYIKTFDIDRLKIAKELIDNISKDDGSLQIVKAIIMMADAMKLKTIAEGVEYSDQLEKLIELGCAEIQGYIFGKPVPANEFEEKFMNKLIVSET